MKTANYILLIIILLSTLNCSAAPRQSENIAANAPNNSNTAAAVNESSTSAAAVNQVQAAAPDALIRDLYKTHDKNNGAIVQGKNRPILDKYFDKNLADLIWKDMTTNQNEVGVIDFDIFYNTQDPEIKKFAVGAPKIDGDKANVPVTFENGGRKETLTYALVKVKSGWRISDIKYGGDSLLKYFKDAETSGSDKADANQTREFEGTYRVGDTTCTVKPIKMAFEIKWAKGTGTEIFFSEDRADDKYIFASDPKNGKANVFSFDDENDDTGTFYRADGKEFKLERMK